MKTKLVCVNFWTWQHQKRSNSARLPQETSSIFEVDNIKNEAILRDFLQKWKIECRVDSLVQMHFAIFPLHLCKVLRLQRKSDAWSYEVLHLSHTIILPNQKSWCSKMQPLSGNHLLTSLLNMSLVLRLPRKMPLCRSSSNVPRLPTFLKLLQNRNVLLLWQGAESFAPATQNNAATSKSGTNMTSKCASRHSSMHFLTFWASQLPSAPRMVSFVHFDLEMRHNDVQLVTSHLATLLRTRRFIEPTFRPSGATKHWKNTVFRDYPTSSCTLIFSLLTLSLSSLICFLLTFSCLILPTSASSSVHIVGIYRCLEGLCIWWSIE